MFSPKALTASLALSLTSIALPALAENASLEVTAAYRERIALPPNAQLVVELRDVSRADAPSRRLSQQVYAMQGSPKTVSLSYDTDVVDTRFGYALSAQIVADGAVMFRSVDHIPVLQTADDTTAEILLVQANTAMPDTIVGISWSLFELDGRSSVDSDPPTLAVNPDGSFSLFGGCNRFNGRLTLDGTEVRFPAQMAGTLMACPPEREALERALLSGVQGVVRYERSGALLQLMDEENRVLMRFRETLG